MADVVVTAPFDAGLLRGHTVRGPRDWHAALGRADALVCTLADRIDEALLARAPRLRVVGTVSVGYDHVDVATCRDRGIAVVHTPGVLTDATADLAIGLMLAAARRFPEGMRDVATGEWRGWTAEAYVGRDVSGATLGIVGFGRVGRAVATRAAAFGMTVLHHSRTPTGEAGWVGALPDLLAAADFVSLHVPLTPQTRHLVGARELTMIGPHGVLVNTSRGAVVDEAALAAALAARTLFAAGLDVYEGEPAVHPALRGSPYAVLLPHVGSATVRTRQAMARLCAQGVAAVLDGRTPSNALP